MMEFAMLKFNFHDRKIEEIMFTLKENLHSVIAAHNGKWQYCSELIKLRFNQGSCNVQS